VPITDDDRAVDTRGGPLTQYKPLLRRFGIRLCVSVTLALMVLAAVELYSYKRYRNYGQNDVLEPGAKLELQENGTAAEREYWKEFEQSNKVMYHQYVLWRRAPYQGDMISINPEGVRRTLHTQCDEKTLTIWMYGDSVMWGGGAPDAETIPSLIALDYEKAGKPVCIVNYGEKGWSNTQEMVALIEQLKHASRKPDIVLFYDGGTEAFAAYQSGQADVHSNYGMFKDFLDNWGAKQRASFDYLRETNTYRLLAKIASQSPLHRKEEHGQKSHLDVEALSSAVIDNYKQNMDIIDLLAKQYGFRAIFAWYPNLAVGHKEMTPFEQQVLRIQYQDFPELGPMYQAVYRKSGTIGRPNFYDLEDLLDDRKDSLYVGISHMKPEGDRIVADHLFDILEGKGINSKSAVATVTAHGTQP
jgi:hypothetical protein